MLTIFANERLKAELTLTKGQVERMIALLVQEYNDIYDD
jgi:hypothetical protein